MHSHLGKEKRKLSDLIEAQSGQDHRPERIPEKCCGSSPDDRFQGHNAQDNEKNLCRIFEEYVDVDQHTEEMKKML
jgi:hypothetical protein